MTSAQILRFFDCPSFGGHGLILYAHYDLSSCLLCSGSGSIQSGDLCRSPAVSSDAVGQGNTNKSDLDNVYVMDLTSADATAAAVVKSKSPHTITSGLLYHGDTKHSFQSYFRR